MSKEKKAWVTPELIVLVRNKPEEAVLVMCKLASSGADSKVWPPIASMRVAATTEIATSSLAPSP
jgi:hypothetical protein